jgi:thioredoxin reductase (NADPH)
LELGKVIFLNSFAGCDINFIFINMADDKKYNLVIIGAGPAGLSASIYASRYGIYHLVVGSLAGGQISETHLIDNYPGIEDATGFDFSQKLSHHAQKYGTEIIPTAVKSIVKQNNLFELNLDNGNTLKTKTILLATGTKRRNLGVKGEEEFLGKGVSHCATCDGFFYRNKTVAVIGGSDSAAGAAVYLADIAEKVYLIYRKEQLRCEPYWQKLIEKNSKIEVVYNTNLTEIVGQDKVEKAVLDKEYKGNAEFAVDGVFIEIGSDPNIDFARDLQLEIDEKNYIKIQRDSATSLAGVWAAGDITDGSDKFRQVITAAAEGAIAARSIFNYLKK